MFTAHYPTLFLILLESTSSPIIDITITIPIISYCNMPRARNYLGLVDMWWVEYLDLSYLVFFIGLSGTIFNYKNFLVTMLNIELMYLGILSSIAIASVFSYAVSGQIYALFILILAAAESAIGLGLLVVSFKYRRTLNFNAAQRLRG